MSMRLDLTAYLHPAGCKQTPKHSEYEIDMSGVSKMGLVKNAILKNGSFLQVIDEKKPVFAIIYGIWDERICKFESHMDGSKKKQGNVK